MTASNKIWSYEELIKSGADAFWAKEGIDNNFSAEDSFRNFNKLLWLTEKLTSPEYYLLKTIADGLKEFDTFTTLWWESKDWIVNTCDDRNGRSATLKQITNVPKNVVIKIYNDCLNLYREFLLQKFLYRSEIYFIKNDWFYYSSILIHGGKIIEAIHNYYNAEFRTFGSLNKLLDARNDTNGIKIYNMRNDAAHLGKSQNIAHKELVEFMEMLINYLFFP
jgi:hypothetical protein